MSTRLHHHSDSEEDSSSSCTKLTSKQQQNEGSNNKNDLGLSHDYTHTAIMVVLYLAQGVFFGMKNACVTLVQQERDVSMSDISILTLPGYAYSLKFLWAPVVDSVYFKKRTRRPLWILGCQLIICLFSLFIRAFWFEFLRDSIYALVTVMFVLTITVATQDIAVDAWAVEGVSASRSSFAASAQTMGLLTGWCCTRSFFIFQEWGWVSKENGAIGLFTVVFVVQLIVFVVTVFYLQTATCTRALDAAETRELTINAEKKQSTTTASTTAPAGGDDVDSGGNTIIVVKQQRNKSSSTTTKQQKQKTSSSSSATSAAHALVTEINAIQSREQSTENRELIVGQDSTYEAFMGVVTDMKQVVREPWFADVVTIILLRGIAWGGEATVGPQQLKRYGISPAFASSLYLALLPLQLFVSSSAPGVISFLQQKLSVRSIMQVWWWLNTVQLAVDALGWYSFTKNASDSSFYRNWCVIPSEIGSVIVSTLCFNACTTFASKLASLVPHSTGTVMTLLNSMMNFGMTWPATLALAVGGRIAPMYAEDSASAAAASSQQQNGNATSAANSSSGSSSGEPLIVTYLVLWGFVCVGIVVRYTLIYPAVQRVSQMD